MGSDLFTFLAPAPREYVILVSGDGGVQFPEYDVDAAVLVYEASYVVDHGCIATLAGAGIRLAETEEFQEATKCNVIASVNLHIHNPKTVG